MAFFLRPVLLCAAIVGGLASGSVVYGQKVGTVEKPSALNPAASSPAYAEVLMRRTELRSELESLLVEYTEDYPRVKEIRFVLTLLDRDMARINKVKPAESSKLTLALGKLLVRRTELETDLWNLEKNYKEEHPDVKRAKRKLEIYEAAIGEILN